MAADFKTAAVFVVLNLLVVAPLIYFIMPRSANRIAIEDRAKEDRQTLKQLLMGLGVQSSPEVLSNLSHLSAHSAKPTVEAVQNSQDLQQLQLQQLLSDFRVDSIAEARTRLSQLTAEQNNSLDSNQLQQLLSDLGVKSTAEARSKLSQLLAEKHNSPDSKQLQQLLLDLGAKSTSEARSRLSQLMADEGNRQAHAYVPKAGATDVQLPLAIIFGAAAITNFSDLRREWWNKIVPTIEEAFNKGHPQFPYNPKGGHESTEPASCCGAKNIGKWPASRMTDRADFLGPIGPPCPHELSVFGESHEEKHACAFKELHAKETCNVISIGCNNEWKFEEALFAKTNCVAHVFDCTGPGTWKPPEAIRSRTHFYDICIGANDSGKYLTWNSMLHKAGLSKSPAYLKIDVEGFEWMIFPSLFTQGADHLLPHQIAVEIHPDTRMRGLRWKGRFKSVGEYALFGDMIYRSGYNIIEKRGKEFLLARLRPRSSD